MEVKIPGQLGMSLRMSKVVLNSNWKVQFMNEYV